MDLINRSLERIGQMTLEDLIKLYEVEGPFEFVNGEVVPLAPMVMGHNRIAKRIYDTLLLHLHDHPLGEIHFEAPLVLTYEAGWVEGSRVPDIMFIRAERWATYIQEHRDWAAKPMILVPDSVIEVLSNNDVYSDVEEKVDRYLEDSVQIVWIVDPRREAVTVYGRGSFRRMGKDDVLDVGDIIPGFHLPVKAIFESA